MIVCVTGTGTDVGKTVATAALAVAAARAGWRVRVAKPIQTGEPAGRGDLAEVQRLAGVEDVHEFVRYPDPLAPVMAARVAGMSTLTCAGVAERVSALDGADGPEGSGTLVLVEGAGGLLVELGLGLGPELEPELGPVDAPWGIADLAARLGAPVVVVTTTGLGSLNHAGLTLEAIHHRGLTCAGLIGGSVPHEPDLATRLNLEEFQRGFGPAHTPWLGAVPEGAGALAREEFMAGVAEWIRLPPLLPPLPPAAPPRTE